MSLPQPRSGRVGSGRVGPPYSIDLITKRIRQRIRAKNQQRIRDRPRFTSVPRLVPPKQLSASKIENQDRYPSNAEVSALGAELVDAINQIVHLRIRPLAASSQRLSGGELHDVPIDRRISGSAAWPAYRSSCSSPAGTAGRPGPCTRRLGAPGSRCGIPVAQSRQCWARCALPNLPIFVAFVLLRFSYLSAACVDI